MRSVLVGRAAKKNGPLHTTWRPVSDAATQLAALVDLYRVGRILPLPFFARSSRVYIEQRRAGKGREAALDEAAKAFRGGDPWRPWSADGYDDYVIQIYGGRLPFDRPPVAGVPSFEAVACRVYEPFFDHLEDAGT
jgi:exonuclease V gamma subunit